MALFGKDKKKGRFIVKTMEMHGGIHIFEVVVDTQTGVNYLQATRDIPNNISTSITPLYNSDGTVIVTEEHEG